jgi:hypothetical protein
VLRGGVLGAQESHDGENKSFKFGVTAMQGWRTEMVCLLPPSFKRMVSTEKHLYFCNFPPQPLMSSVFVWLWLLPAVEDFSVRVLR